MNEIKIQFFSFLSAVLFSRETDAALNEEIITESKLQAVQGLVDPSAYQVLANSVRITRAHRELCALLEGIPFVTIKGCASAFYYPQPLKRTMGDVDFFVEKKYFEEAERKLLQAGFTFDHETELHRCFRKAGISYEMHSAVNGAPEGGPAVQQLLEDLISTSREVTIGNDTVRIPDDFHNGLICLLHICRHLKRSETGLRQLCDWACLVNRVENFEDLFREKLECAGLWTCARIFSLAAVKYLGLPYQSWMGEKDNPAVDLLMEEVMASGNMGKKRDEYETQWFVDPSGSGSGVKGVLHSLNCKTREYWPAARKCPLLYPFGWVYFSLRYFIRSLLGKRRRIDLTAITRRAETKNRLLESLQLFRV